MKAITARRISQVFFLAVFFWTCIVATLGESCWQLRGWPVKWILELDPLVGLGTVLATQTLYRGLLWGLAVIFLTIILGRFFCGWICPFGTLHQGMTFLGRRNRPVSRQIAANRFDSRQSLKYWILIFLLSASAADLINFIAALSPDDPRFPWLMAASGSIIVLLGFSILVMKEEQKGILSFIIVLLSALLFSFFSGQAPLLQSSLQTGLLDPIPLMYRSVNLVLVPLADLLFMETAPIPRRYEGAGFIGALFLAALFINLKIPRFYCRFICPLGALLGLLSRHALWRIGKTEADCAQCLICEKECEGACAPSTQIIISECILCLNCLDTCDTRQIAYQSGSSASGEILLPDLPRRSFLVSMVSGITVIPMIRIHGLLASNWNPDLVRPPGARPENEFLSRCIKCGHCMRICPTNVIQPAAFEGGIEGIWTPILNFRTGASGCRHTCIACGHLCPTGAIRPLTLDERMGKNLFVNPGPIRIGTAFIDRGRCFPWAMDKPCIVCQENCPVSPKAIFTRVLFSELHNPVPLIISGFEATRITLRGAPLLPSRYATGDYFCSIRGNPDSEPRKIISNSAEHIVISPKTPWKPWPESGSELRLLIRLQQPYVDIDRCIGCGICEHECPVSGLRAIRVTAENESRSKEKTLTPLLQGSLT
ncbi:MAG: 4Fe-4S binding protein [Thermodesulfobacteriota bacterium]